MVKKLSLFIVIFIANIFNVFSQKSYQQKNFPFNLESLTLLSGQLKYDDTIIPVHTTLGFKYINRFSGAVAIKQKFEVAYPFYQKFGLVKVNGKFGVIDKKGVFVVKPTFPGFEVSSQSCPFLINLQFNDTAFFSFRDGSLLKSPLYSEEDPVLPYIREFKVGKKFGLKIKSDTIAKPIYDSVLLIAYSEVIVKKAGKIGMLGTHGQLLANLEYDSYSAFDTDCKGDGQGVIYSLKKGKSWTYYKYGKKLFESAYGAELSDGVLLVKIGNRYNYLNDKGNLCLRENYRWISKNGRVGVREDYKIVLLFADGRAYIYYS